MNTYKKRRAFSSLKYDIATLNRGAVLIFSAVFLILGMFTRWVCGSPVFVIHSLGVSDIVPPVFLLVLLFSAFYILAGLSLSVCLFGTYCGDVPERYKGGMYFFIMLALSYVWYPMFFCAKLIFISSVVAILCLFAGILASISFAKVSRLAFFSMTLCNALLLYLTILNIRIFLTV